MEHVQRARGVANGCQQGVHVLRMAAHLPPDQQPWQVPSERSGTE